MKRILQRGAALLCAFICMAGFAVPALAYTAIDTGKTASLTIVYGEKKAIPNASFQLYKVADVSDRGKYILSEDFEKYSVSLEGLDSAGWRAAAETLSAYAQRDELKALRSGVTDSQGYLTFSNLDVALYLVVGQKIKTGSYTYTPAPMLVQLPNTDEKDQWVYDVTASPKYEEEYMPEGGGGGNDGGDDDDTITRRVLKVWNDEGQRAKRPDNIVVQLLRDGRVFDRVTLSEENHWRHTWEDLDDDYVWQVVERKAPDGYTVSVSREGITFVITNTLSRNKVPSTKSTVNIPDEEVPLSSGRQRDSVLPQTGMLWWPVPLLACGGVLLFMCGWVRKRNEEQNEN